MHEGLCGGALVCCGAVGSVCIIVCGVGECGWHYFQHHGIMDCDHVSIKVM